MGDVRGETPPTSKILLCRKMNFCRATNWTRASGERTGTTVIKNKVTDKNASQSNLKQHPTKKLVKFRPW